MWLIAGRRDLWAIACSALFLGMPGSMNLRTIYILQPPLSCELCAAFLAQNLKDLEAAYLAMA